MWFLIGLIMGLFGGFMFAVVCCSASEQQAVKNGYIKLAGGKIYRLKEITKDEESGNSKL